MNHIEKIKGKLNRGLYILRRVSKILPSKILKTLYYSVIDAYLNYAISIWGGTFQGALKPLFIIQKEAIRVIYKRDFNAPTNKLFRNNRILKLGQLYNLNIGKLTYRYMTGEIPNSLKILYTLNNNIHPYFTRNRYNPHLFNRNSMVYQNSFLFKGLKLWVNLPDDIKNLNNLYIFSKRLKNYSINN